jgi:hypothetical protein
MQSYDDRLTFLLPRPLWVIDLDVVYCTACNASFGTLKRRVSFSRVHESFFALLTSHL